jgi:hypothetical protein
MQSHHIQPYVHKRRQKGFKLNGQFLLVWIYFVRHQFRVFILIRINLYLRPVCLYYLQDKNLSNENINIHGDCIYFKPLHFIISCSCQPVLW